MNLVLSIDVEEEGLFRGRHPRHPAGVANVAELRRLEPLADEFGLVPTLLVAHAVATDPGCRAILRDWRDRRGAEIGAHLHPWSTPPFDGPGEDGPTDPDAVPEPLLRAKLEALLDAVGGLAGARHQSPRQCQRGNGPPLATGRDADAELRRFESDISEGVVQQQRERGHDLARQRRGAAGTAGHAAQDEFTRRRARLPPAARAAQSLHRFPLL